MSDSLICDVARNIIIIAHKEDTKQLESAFIDEGLVPNVLRRSYTDNEMAYSQSIRVLLSHLEAWKLCIASQSSAIICEADFVPCRGFGRFPAPLPWTELSTNNGLAWLYACGPSIYHIEQIKSFCYARGHCAAPVAILLTPGVAQKLCEFGVKELESSDPFLYSTWDTRITSYLKDENVKSFISQRNFGEHGGIPNSEHRVYGGLPAAHRADSLMGRLHFLPLYARGSKTTFLAVRFKAKLYGLVRIFSFRLVRLQTLLSKDYRELLAMLHFAFARIFCWY